MWIYSEKDCRQGTLCGSTPEGLSWLLQRRVELKQSKGLRMGNDRKGTEDASDHLTHARAAEQAWWITVNTDRNKYVHDRKPPIGDFLKEKKRTAQDFVWLVL